MTTTISFVNENGQVEYTCMFINPDQLKAVLRKLQRATRTMVVEASTMIETIKEKIREDEQVACDWITFEPAMMPTVRLDRPLQQESGYG